MSRARDIANYGDGIDASSITSGTFTDARIAQSNVTQHESAIDALGNVTSGTFNGTIGSSVSGYGVILNADLWRVDATITGGAAFITGADTFERVISSNSDITVTSPATIGTGMSYDGSTGAFTFPVTGKWLITAYATHYSVSGAQAYAGMYIYATADNTNYYAQGIQLTSVSATNYYNSGSTQYFFDCTNTSTHKVKFYRATSNSDLRMIGGSSQNESFISFIRLGDT